MLLAAIILTPLGIVGVILGWRGRRVGRMPCCARCGFDLTGVYPKRVGCPECGSHLEAPGAMRTGRRKKRRSLLWGSLAVFLLGIALLSLHFARADLNRVKPVSLLAFEAEAGAPARARRALDELERRLRADELPASAVTRLVDTGLEIQSDRDRRWDGGWGNLIELAWQKQLASDAMYNRYLGDALSYTLEVRPRAHAGSEISVGLRVTADRISDSPTQLIVSAAPSSARFADIPLDLPPKRPAQLGLAGMGSRGRIHDTVEIPRAPMGGSPLDTVWGVTIGIIGQEDRVTTDVPVSAILTIVRPEDPLVEVVRGEALDRHMRDAVKEITLKASPRDDGRVSISVRLTVGERPEAIACRVLLRDDAGEHDLVAFSVPAGGGQHAWAGGGTVEGGFTARTVDVILRSDPAVASATTSIERMWAGEIVINGVAVEWPDG